MTLQAAGAKDVHIPVGGDWEGGQWERGGRVPRQSVVSPDFLSFSLPFHSLFSLSSLLTVSGWLDAGAWDLGARVGRSEFLELAWHLSVLAQHLKLSLGSCTGHPGSSQVN